MVEYQFFNARKSAAVNT